MKIYRFIWPVAFFLVTGCRSQQLNLPEMNQFQETAWKAVQPLQLPAGTNLDLRPKGNQIIASFTNGLKNNKYAEVRLDKETIKVLSVKDLRNK